MQMNPEEMSKNLNKSGGYIPGIRPGTDTSTYISNVLGKITIGGTGLLIVVGVAIETYKQLESSLVSRSYKKDRKRI